MIIFIMFVLLQSMAVEKDVKPADNVSGSDPESEQAPQEDPDRNIALHCVLENDLERFVKCFEDEEDIYHEKVPEMMCARNEKGKNATDLASILGRVDMLNELLTRGAEVDNANASGSIYIVCNESEAVAANLLIRLWNIGYQVIMASYITSCTYSVLSEKKYEFEA